MTLNKTQSDQMVNEAALQSIGAQARETVQNIIQKVSNELDAPLRLFASFPTPDTKLNFSASILTMGDGANKSAAPVSSQVYNIPASSIDFQTQATTGATFLITWPTSNTVGKYRRIGFTLLGNGSIQALFSSEASSVAALDNAGTLFVKSGTSLGYIDLICTDITTTVKFKTANSATTLIENADIYRFGSGSGGGSGTGNANEFNIYLAERLDESYFQFAMPAVFSETAQAMVSAASASYNLVNSTYDYSAAAQYMTTIQMYTTSFLSNNDEGRQLELHAEWFSSSTRDDTAIYEASMNGGLNWQTISMARMLNTQKFTGRILLDTPTDVTLYSQSTNNSTKELNITAQQSIGQSIAITTKSGLRQFSVNITKNGSPAGSYIIKLCSDSSGQPGTVLQSQIALCSTLNSGDNVITLNGFKQIATSGTYWITIETDSTYKAGFVTATASISIATSSSVSGYAYNGVSWATLSGAGIVYSILGSVYDLRIRVTSSASGKSLLGIGVLYDEQVGSIVDGLNRQQSFVFDGANNQYQFTVTRFLPDSRILKIYDVVAGQVYIYPAFNIDGRTVTFPSGTFLSPGNQMNLLFDQSQGVGYDNSDMNAALLTANHLGSSDSTVDRSSAGRGPLIRNRAGVLKEIWLDENNNLQITAPKG